LKFGIRADGFDEYRAVNGGIMVPERIRSYAAANKNGGEGY
jgi:hypothetical protein